MLAVLFLSVFVLIIFAPLAIRSEAFFSYRDECVYFDIKFFRLILLRKKIFIKNKNFFYFKGYKQYPLIKGKTQKNLEEVKIENINEALELIGQIEIKFDLFLSTEDAFKGAMIVALIDNVLGALSAIGLKVNVNSAFEVGKQRFYFKLNTSMKTDFVKIFLTGFTILKRKRRLKGG